MGKLIEGITSGGRHFRRLELEHIDEIYCAHAALTYEYGEDSQVAQIVARRIAKLALSTTYESPLVLRGHYATDALARMDMMAHDPHDGFSELADVTICDEWAPSDYAHMPEPQKAA